MESVFYFIKLTPVVQPWICKQLNKHLEGMGVEAGISGGYQDSDRKPVGPRRESGVWVGD
jgi:hypothetical protein